MRTLYLVSTMLTLAGAAQAEIQTITPGHGSLTDAAGTVWTITRSGSIKQGDTYTPGGGGTSTLTIGADGTVYGEDSNGKGWFALSGNGRYWAHTPTPPGIGDTTSQVAGQTTTKSRTSSTSQTGTQANQGTSDLSAVIQTPTAPIPCPADAATGGTEAFVVSGGQILAPNGKPFVARGINIMYSAWAPSLQQVQAAFPGVNFIRLPVYDFTADVGAYVTLFTSAGIVVEIEDHTSSDGQNRGGGTGVVYTGALLSSELAWYARIANQFKGNPYVWFGTNNEPSVNPSVAALSNWQLQTVQAIRSTGNANPVMVEMNCDAVNLCGAGYTPSAYAGMKNIIWDMHYYNWLTNYSADQTVIANKIAALAQSAQQVTSSDGTVPILIGEYGNSTTGTTIDPGGTEAVAAVINMGSTGATIGGKQQQLGSAAWMWGPGDPGDGLTTSSGAPSNPYGQMVQLAVGTSTIAPSACQVQQQASATVTSAMAQAMAPQTTQTAQNAPSTQHVLVTQPADTTPAGSQTPASDDPSAPSPAVTSLTTQATSDTASADQIIAGAMAKAAGIGQ